MYRWHEWRHVLTEISFTYVILFPTLHSNHRSLDDRLAGGGIDLTIFIFLWTTFHSTAISSQDIEYKYSLSTLYTTLKLHYWLVHYEEYCYALPSLGIGCCNLFALPCLLLHHNYFTLCSVNSKVWAQHSHLLVCILDYSIRAWSLCVRAAGINLWFTFDGLWTNLSNFVFVSRFTWSTLSSCLRSQTEMNWKGGQSWVRSFTIHPFNRNKQSEWWTTMTMIAFASIMCLLLSNMWNHYPR